MKTVEVAHMAGSHDLLLTSVTLYVSQERLKLESPVRAVHSMQPLPNYFGLLLMLEF